MCRFNMDDDSATHKASTLTALDSLTEAPLWSRRSTIVSFRFKHALIRSVQFQLSLFRVSADAPISNSCLALSMSSRSTASHSRSSLPILFIYSKQLYIQLIPIKLFLRTSGEEETELLLPFTVFRLPEGRLPA